MQSHPNLCGPAALANAFRALGKTTVTEDKIAGRIQSTASAVESPAQDGAGVRSLQRAAETLGYNLVPWTFTAFEQAWAYVAHALREGRPALLAVDSGQSEDGHWVTAVGTIGDGLLVADPAEAEIVEPVSAKSLDTRWKADDGTYYALVLTKMKKGKK